MNTPFEQFPLDIVSSCLYQESCSGCQHLGTAYGHQIENKERHLFNLLSQHEVTISTPITSLSCGPDQLRDRLDFSLIDGRLGLYQKNNRDLVDIEQCAQLSPALQNWLSEFRNIRWPFKKGSIRLRVGPENQRGAWLDFANVDIKTLLDEKNILKDLQKKCFVEIGQRRKVPTWNGNEFKLKDPENHIWFQTWINETPVDLYCQIASFTQPSLKANRMIATLLNGWLKSLPRSRVIEFGSGIGNLTLPALGNCEHILACEIDELALQGLQKSLQNLPSQFTDLKGKITIHRGDFQKKLKQDFSQFDVVLANPPRSGLMNFLDPLAQIKSRERPSHFIYMSCFPESLALDLSKLNKLGYICINICIIDQFPQTNHYEVMTLLQRV